MTTEIWNDLLVRMRNLRGDLIGQWQGDLDNKAIEQTLMTLGNAMHIWEDAKPPEPPAQLPG